MNWIYYSIGGLLLLLLGSWCARGVEWTRELFEALFYVAAIGAALASVVQYRQNSSSERTRRLFELYQKFYTDGRMQQVRLKLDWDETGFISEFLNHPQDDRHKEKLAELDDYLNFFHFLSYLVELGQVSKADVRAMFAYFLDDLGREPIPSYLSKYGYRKLYNLLEELGYLKNGSTPNAPH